MNSESIIRYIVKEVIKHMNRIREVSVTGNVAGYQTPYAFSRPKDNARKKKYLKKLGYTPVNEGKWHDFKNDKTRTNPKKLSDGIREARKHLSEANKYLEWCGKIKQEGDSYYSNSLKNLNSMQAEVKKIEEKINSMLNP